MSKERSSTCTAVTEAAPRMETQTPCYELALLRKGGVWLGPTLVNRAERCLRLTTDPLHVLLSTCGNCALTNLEAKSSLCALWASPVHRWLQEGRVVLLPRRGLVVQKSYLLAYVNMVDLNSPKDIHNVWWILELRIKGNSLNKEST